METPQARRQKCEEDRVDGEAPTKCKKKKLEQERSDDVNVRGNLLNESGCESSAKNAEQEDVQKPPGESAGCSETGGRERNATDANATPSGRKDKADLPSRCARLINDIQGLASLLDGMDGKPDYACARVKEMEFLAKNVADFCQGRVPQPKIKFKGRKVLRQDNQLLQSEIQQLLRDKEELAARCGSERAARHSAESERDKAVGDLNQTRAELAAAFPSGGDIVGTFPLAREIRNTYEDLCRQRLFDLAPDKVADTVKMFTAIFESASSYSRKKLRSSEDSIREGLEIDDAQEWKPVEGYILKAQRLRRSAIFGADDSEVESWIEENREADGPFSVLLETNADGKALLVQHVQALVHLMGCCLLSQPVLGLDPAAIGQQEPYSAKLHQVLDGRGVAGKACTIVFPPLLQGEGQQRLSKAYVLP